ncbi:hypothetical protein Trydic_g13693 [Trypoxylus dichotomus]
MGVIVQRGQLCASAIRYEFHRTAVASVNRPECSWNFHVPVVLLHDSSGTYGCVLHEKLRSEYHDSIAPSAGSYLRCLLFALEKMEPL